MSATQGIVPSKPVEYRLVRRKKSWVCGIAAIALTPITALLSVDQLASEAQPPTAWLVGCAALTCISGILALVFRLKEQPVEITVRRDRDWPPVIH